MTNLQSNTVRRSKRRNPSTLISSSPEVNLLKLLRSLNKQSYFDLSRSEKQILRSVPVELGFKIDGWSFVPHPAVIRALQKGRPKVVRYIIAIETLRAKIYFAVHEFLLSFTMNVNSYFTGGSSDFICDVSLAETSYAHFLSQLTKVLVGAGAGKIEDIDKIVSIFRVDEALILCGQEIAGLGKPDQRVVDKICQDPAKFELVFRDYLSPEAEQMFRSKRDLRNYIAELKEAKAIIGFRARLDQCRFVDREYVPLCHGRALDNLLRGTPTDSTAILKPVVELLSVTPVQPTDQAEREVTHIFINEYDWPGTRNDWRRATYEALGDDLNMFTFPLEGTLNESPISLSDLPEAVAEARMYSGAICLGELMHPFAPSKPPKVALEREALAFQGITLGLPGTGKTNTDCVLLCEVAEILQRVIVLDTTRGKSIRGKLGEFPDAVAGNVHFLTIPSGSTDPEIQGVLDKCGAGLNVVESEEIQFPQVFDACLTRIEEEGGNVGNSSRVISTLLLIEEANDAFGSGESRAARINKLESVLTKAYRKGWCIWLSTQEPLHVGYDEASAIRILRLLHNRIFHRLEKKDISIVEKVLDGNCDPAEIRNKIALISEFPNGIALLHGTKSKDGQLHPLPPIVTRIRMLARALRLGLN